MGSDGTLLVAVHNRAFRSRSDWHDRSRPPRHHYHSGHCDHPSPHGRRSEEHRLENDCCLVLLTILSYVFDFLGSYFGAKYFGATKWGAFGAILGALIGLFFGILGLFVGPVVGAIAGEFIAGKRMIDAGRAGWGSLLGNLGAMLGKLAIALA